MIHRPFHTNQLIKDNILYSYSPVIGEYCENNPVDLYTNINVFGVYSIYDDDRHGW